MRKIIFLLFISLFGGCSGNFKLNQLETLEKIERELQFAGIYLDQNHAQLPKEWTQFASPNHRDILVMTTTLNNLEKFSEIVKTTKWSKRESQKIDKKLKRSHALRGVIEKRLYRDEIEKINQIEVALAAIGIHMNEFDGGPQAIQQIIKIYREETKDFKRLSEIVGDYVNVVLKIQRIYSPRELDLFPLLRNRLIKAKQLNVYVNSLKQEKQIL